MRLLPKFVSSKPFRTFRQIKSDRLLDGVSAILNQIFKNAEPARRGDLAALIGSLAVTVGGKSNERGRLLSTLGEKIQSGEPVNFRFDQMT